MLTKLEVLVLNRCIFHLQTKENKARLQGLTDDIHKGHRFFGNKVVAYTLGTEPNGVPNDYDLQPKQFLEDLRGLLSVKEVKTTQTGSDKLTYKQALNKHNYKGVSKVRDTKAEDILKVFVDNYLELEEASSKANGCSCNIIEANKGLLSKEYDNLSGLSVFNRGLQEKYEELRFGVYFKKTRQGGNLLIKLPRGSQINMQGKKGMDYHRIPRLLGYSAILNNPVQKSIGVYLNEDLREEDNYTCVVFTMIDSLRDFASNKSNAYLYKDYEEYCLTGNAQNGYECFTPNDKVLGDDIVVGISADGAERLTIDGINNAGCLVLGGPGSGKTTLLDTIMIQALNLRDEPKGDGNGAIVIVDNKTSEWTGGWKPAFERVGKHLYGFDGSSIDPRLLVYSKKGVRTSIEGAIPKYVAGAYFLTDIRSIIRALFSEAGVNKVSKYNTGNYSIDGITKIPRIVCLVDEFNSLAGTEYRKDLKQHLLIAKDTRQVNMGWFIAGQELPASVIPNNELQSYPNRIVGNLPEGTGGGSDRYGYYNIKIDSDVERYSQQNTNVLTQGVFYYKSSTGSPTLIKSMYLPDTEREQALQETASRTGLKGLTELDALVRYGIAHELFKSELTTVDKRYPGNNILAACLYELGIISEVEYKQLTEFKLNKYLNSGEKPQANTIFNGSTESIDTSQPSHIKQTVQNIPSKQTPQPSHIKQTTQSIMGTQKPRTAPIRQAPEPQVKQSTGKGVNGYIDVPRTMGEALYKGRKSGRYVLNSEQINESNIAQGIQEHMIDCSNVGVGMLGIGIKNMLYNKSPQYVEIVRKDTWRNIIRQASRSLGGRNRVVRLEALDNNLYLNQRYIDISGVLNADVYTDSEVSSLTDLIDFKHLDGLLPSLNNITIDADKYRKLCTTLGDNAVQLLYQRIPYLRELAIMYPNGEKLLTHRDDITDLAKLKERQYKEHTFKQFTKAKASAKQGKLLKTVGWGALGAVIGFGSIGLLATKKLYKEFTVLKG